MTVTIQDLPEILEKHRKWLVEENGGVRADLSWADLTEANLSEVKLFWANLSGAKLTEANLSGASITWADLSWAKLNGADLSGASLSGAELFRANLSGADLSGAYLFRADLTGANLRGANLTGANLNGADLSGANLTGAVLEPGVILIGKCPILQIGPILQNDLMGPRNSYLLAFKTNVGIRIKTGCFYGTIAEFSENVGETHDGSDHERHYKAAIAMIEAVFMDGDEELTASVSKKSRKWAILSALPAWIMSWRRMVTP